MQEKGRKKNQEKRIILAFLREEAGILLWVVFFIGSFWLLCFLEDIPQDATIYTLQLASFTGIAVLIVRFIRYRKRCKTLELLTKDPRDKIEAFPNPDTLSEKLYRQIIGQYERELRKEEQQMDDRYREMVEYYTMWTHQIKTPIAAMHLLLQEEETPVSKELQGELFQVEQYVQMAERLAGTGVHLLEMNISCPNVHEGGVAFGVKPESVYAITKAVKAAAKQPLIVKLTPNVSDITENALAAEEAGANAISMINTLTGIAVDTNKRKMVLANNTGGLSGPAVRPVALRMVWQSAKKVHIPIIGMGGIETGEDAAAFMLCGAKAVMVGTANFTDPFACPRIIRELDAYCDRQNVRSAQELVGTLEENG